MPVTKLLVEGDLDSTLLFALVGGSDGPLIERAGSKDSLGPQVRKLHTKNLLGARYLRDRDFDSLPPSDLTRPTDDKYQEHQILGWRWTRHAIESYMIEPHFVALCLGVDQGSYESALIDAARKIRFYQAARWTIGQARTQLPPSYKFGTSPDDRSGEFYLPEELESKGQRNWARIHAKGFLERVSPILDEPRIVQVYDEFSDRFIDDFHQDPQNILIWFSGKDLMKALEPWLLGCGVSSASVFRTYLRDWMTSHIEDVAAHLSEWRALRELLRN